MFLNNASIRTKIFVGLFLVSLVGIIGATAISYYIIRRAYQIENESHLQKKAEALMASLDYAVSHSLVTEDQVADVLKNKIYEIADINKHDILIYDLDGNYLISNKDPHLIRQKKIPNEILAQIIKNNKRLDFVSYDEATKTTVTSSYLVLTNNEFQPIAIVYFPSYYTNNQFFYTFKNYLQLIVVVNVFMLFLSMFLSYVISKNITKSITRISNKIENEGTDLKPIKYYNNDELSVLVRSYNKMLYMMREQNQVQAHIERENAWREMAKQVAHEVKNPLTPMKLMVQNFERKFDAQDPNVEEKVHNLSKTIIDQIDLIATVASAFSEFAKMPEKDEQIINANEEIINVVEVFNKDDIFFKANKENIMVRMDRIYLTRILTNLITNAQQAEVEGKKPVIDIDLVLMNKKIRLRVKDNGSGIEKDKLEQIFEPNFTTKTSGMGLGLTMVRKMVEEYKGIITVNSEVGRGTEFEIIMPTNL